MIQENKKASRNVVYHDDLENKLYSSNLGAIHLGFHDTFEDAKDLVDRATALYKSGKPYKHLVQPMTPNLFRRLYPEFSIDAVRRFKKAIYRHNDKFKRECKAQAGVRLYGFEYL
jgi:hypothetical protein